MRLLSIIILFWCFSLKINAQDLKPSKEQTIEYIQSYFKDFKTGFFYDGYRKLTDNYKISIEDCKMTFSFDNYIWMDNTKESTEKFVFSLKDIEVLNIHKGQSDRCNYSIVFRAKNKEDVIRKIKNNETTYVYEAGIDVYHGDNCDLSVEDMKIYKALNHLRKLCGAPDPISFD